jgi:iron complex outermembrane recepter protein
MKIRLALLASILILYPSYTSAQVIDNNEASSNPTETSGNTGLALDEIIVTADRPRSFSASVVQVGTFRNAELIDTPITINVITRELIETQAAVSIHDALRNTAGVSRSESNGSTFDSLLIRESRLIIATATSSTAYCRSLIWPAFH